MFKRRPDRGDEGFSLIEIMVTMTIMSVVTAVTVGAITQIYRVFNKIENSSVARTQLAISFQRLDKEIRYATWLNPPGQVSGAWYLEFQIPPPPTSTTPDQNECRQLILNNGILSLKSWKLPKLDTDPPAIIPTVAPVLGSNLQTISGVQPFQLYAAGSQPFASSPAAAASAGVGTQFKPEFAQVRLQFVSVVNKTTLPFDVTFTAQNNNADSPKVSDCVDGRP